MCVVQAKRLSEAPLYNSVGVAANLVAEHPSSRRLDRILPKAFPPQERCRPRAGPQPGDQSGRPISLGLESRERLGGCSRLDAVPPQEVPDSLVAVPSLGEGGSPCPGVAAVVEVADPLERLERLGPPGVVDAGPGEPLVKLPP